MPISSLPLTGAATIANTAAAGVAEFLSKF